MHMSDTLHNNTVEAAALLTFLTSHWVISEWAIYFWPQIVISSEKIYSIFLSVLLNTASQYSGIFLEFMKAIQKGTPENKEYGALKSHLSSPAAKFDCI